MQSVIANSSFPSPILTEQVNYTLVTPRTISGTDFCVKENTDYALALACFVRFAAPFFQYVVQYANYYHDQCMKEGVTPVRRLQMWIRSLLVMARSRDKRRRRDSPVLHDDLQSKGESVPAMPYLVSVDPPSQVDEKIDANDTSVRVRCITDR